MTAIKFGTDGWRAIIAETYTVGNVRRVARGTALWMKSKGMSKVIIGHDCRFGGKMFLEAAAVEFTIEGIQVIAADGIVSTPMVSLAVVKHNCNLGVVITASHNPPTYNGYKLKSSYGGPSTPTEIEEVEKLIPENSSKVDTDFQKEIEKGTIVLSNLESLYEQHVRSNFDVPAILKQDKMVYDSMFGAGQFVMRKLFPGTVQFHSEHNPGFNNTAPEPIAKNMTELMNYMKTSANGRVAFATDGDADRIAMVDEDGNLVDSHHVLLLLMYYLVEYKKMKGKIVVSCSVSNKINKLAKLYQMECISTKIGFKYIAEYILAGDVLVGGEESGGLAIAGHIPERDGIWIGLTILELMSKTGKSLKELIQILYDKVGSFSYDRLDLHLNAEQMHSVKQILSTDDITEWGPFKVISKEKIDGDKFYFENDSWLMFRASGTEPVLRIYAQGVDGDQVKQIHAHARQRLGI